MHVLILAAGFGTRLKAYGQALPKGLIPVGSTTLLGKVTRELDGHQIAIVTNGRFFSVYQEWIKENNLTPKVTLISDEAVDPESRLGAIGDIVFGLESLSWSDADLLVVPSDTYYEFSIQDFIAFATAKQGFTTVVRRMDVDQIAGRLGCAIVADERITDFVEKPTVPPSDLAAIPFYYYPKDILSLIPEYVKSGGNMDAPGNIIPWLLSKYIPVYAYVTEGKTLDVGTVEDVTTLAAF
jgi:NDP-sugar pyrophosphorylase family protein